MRYLLVVVMLVTLLPTAVYTAQERDAIYQTSTLEALMDGVYDGNTTLGKLKSHGDFGIGCFDRMDGEMVYLDGKFYRVPADGVVRPAKDTDTTPFVAVTYFDRDQSFCLFSPTDFDGLTKVLDSAIPSANMFYAIRIDGTFPFIKTRSVPRQSKPYPKLVEIAAKQPTFEFKNVKGTIIGYRFPSYIDGVNMSGYHFHFISTDRKRGGHLLDCQLGRAEVSLDLTTSIQLVLPNTDEFKEAKLQKDLSKDVEKVEKGK